ncbi:MAG: RNA polymerase sigma factor [Nannocystaceae bacterium]
MADPSIAGLYRLMEQYVDGDRRSYGKLHELLAPRLRRFLVKFVHDDATVDDLIQVTMLKAHLARDRFELQGGNPDGAVQGWYFAIARNVAMDHLRKQYRQDRHLARKPSEPEAADPIHALPDGAPSIEELGLSREAEAEIVERVQAAIARLPESQRAVVELHKLRGMSMAEVARRLQVREGAVRVRAHRAYKSLARWLVPSLLLLILSCYP